MNLFQIAFKSIRQRSLASLLTALSVALGVMLMVAVLVTSGIVDRIFRQNSIGYHLIVGPKGNDMQLVLSTIYRVAPPIENLPYYFYEQIRDDRRVESAVPVAFGDVTEQGSFPIVGTIDKYFEVEYAPGRSFAVQKGGQRMGGDWDAVIGSHVARTNGWKVGTTFKMVHGGAEGHVHNEEFTIVAVLAPTGTANDKSVFVNLNGFLAIDGHDKPIEETEEQLMEFYEGEDDTVMRNRIKSELDAIRKERSGGGHHHGPTPDVLKEVTSVLVVMRKDVYAMHLSAEMKKGKKAIAINPIRPMQKIKDLLVGNIRKALLFLTGLIIVVSGVSIFVSIYNSMSDRKREIAVMRALGAQRTSVFSIILAESVLLCLIGGILGLALGHGLVFLISPYVAAETGLLIDPMHFEPMELILFPILLVLASLVGFIPAMTAYRTDVADALAN
ncbi:ABC transporter permease [bacterium]|nr:ABC transporter permease [bacterium]